jgi:hypothetical protein
MNSWIYPHWQHSILPTFEEHRFSNPQTKRPSTNARAEKVKPNQGSKNLVVSHLLYRIY